MTAWFAVLLAALVCLFTLSSEGPIDAPTIAFFAAAAPSSVVTGLPPGEVPVRWDYVLEGKWASLSPPYTASCASSSSSSDSSTIVSTPPQYFQSPIPIGLQYATAVQLGLVPGTAASDAPPEESPAPTRVVNGFGVSFANCRVSVSGSGGPSLYTVRRLQQSFTITPLPLLPRPNATTTSTSVGTASITSAGGTITTTTAAGTPLFTTASYEGTSTTTLLGTTVLESTMGSTSSSSSSTTSVPTTAATSQVNASTTTTTDTTVTTTNAATTVVSTTPASEEVPSETATTSTTVSEKEVTEAVTNATEAGTSSQSSSAVTAAENTTTAHTDSDASSGTTTTTTATTTAPTDASSAGETSVAAAATTLTMTSTSAEGNATAGIEEEGETTAPAVTTTAAVATGTAAFTSEDLTPATPSTETTVADTSTPVTLTTDGNTTTALPGGEETNSTVTTAKGEPATTSSEVVTSADEESTTTATAVPPFTDSSTATAPTSTATSDAAASTAGSEEEGATNGTTLVSSEEGLPSTSTLSTTAANAAGENAFARRSEAARGFDQQQQQPFTVTEDDIDVSRVCRMVKSDASVWRFSHIVPHARSEHSLNGVHYPLSADFIFYRIGSARVGAQAAQSQRGPLDPSGPIDLSATPSVLEGANITIASFLLSPDASTAATGGVLRGAGLGAFIDEALQNLPLPSDTTSTTPATTTASAATTTAPNSSSADDGTTAYAFVKGNFDLLDEAFSGAAFFSYGGSLTHPPCTQGVSWLVSPHIIPIRSDTAGRLLVANEKAFGLSTGGQNRRSLQPVAGRSVLYFTGDEGTAAPFYDALRASSNGASGLGPLAASAALLAMVVALLVAS